MTQLDTAQVLVVPNLSIACLYLFCQALAGSGGGVATPTPTGGGRVSRGNRTKVLAPKQQQILQQQQQQAALASQLMMPGAAPIMMQVKCQACMALEYGTGSTVFICVGNNIFACFTHNNLRQWEQVCLYNYSPTGLLVCATIDLLEDMEGPGHATILLAHDPLPSLACPMILWQPVICLYKLQLLGNSQQLPVLTQGCICTFPGQQH